MPTLALPFAEIYKFTEMCFGATDGVSDCSGAIQAVINKYGGVLLERGKTYVINSALVPKADGDFFFIDAFGVGPKPIIKHAGTVNAIFVDRSAHASALFAVTGLGVATVNDNYVSEISFSSLDASMTDRKYGVVFSNDPHIGEDSSLISSIVKTTSTSVTIVTARPHGLGASGSVRIAYCQGMTQINGLLLNFTRTNSTTIVCTTTDNSAWGAYTASSGFLTASGSQSWLGEGFQISSTSGNKIRTYGPLEQWDRMNTTPYVKILDNTFKVHIKNIEIQGNGNVFDTAITGENNRCPAILLRACVGVEIDNVTGRKNWSTFCRLETCMNVNIGTMECYESPNLVSYNGYGYGLLPYGACYNVTVGKLKGSQLRHLFTTGSQNSSTAWSSGSWYTKGYSRRININVLEHLNSNGIPGDTHESGVDIHFGKVLIQMSHTSNDFTSPKGGGMSIRTRNTHIDELTVIGGYYGFVLNTTEHGRPSNVTIGRARIVSNGSAVGSTGDNDIGLKIESAAGLKYPPKVIVSDLEVIGFAAPFQAEQDSDLTILKYNFVSCDNAGKVLGGASVVLGQSVFDYRSNPWNNPSHYGVLLYSEAGKSPIVRFLQRPTIIRGDSALKPDALFYAMDSTAAKYYWLPEEGAIEINPSSVATKLAIVSGASSPAIATVSKDTKVRTIGAKKSLRVPIHTAGNASLTLTSMPVAATVVNASTGRSITKVDLSDYSQVRIMSQVSSVGGNAGSKIAAKFATSYTTTAASYSDLGTTEVSHLIDTTVVSSVQDSGWIDLAPAAKTDVWVAAVTTGATDATPSPVLGNCIIEFR